VNDRVSGEVTDNIAHFVAHFVGVPATGVKDKLSGEVTDNIAHFVAHFVGPSAMGVNDPPWRMSDEVRSVPFFVLTALAESVESDVAGT